MELYVTFTDNAVLEGAAPQERFPEQWPQAPIPVETLVVPITEELEGTQVPESGVTSTQEIGEPIEELTPAEVSTEEAAPTEDPTEELAILMATVSKLAEEPDIHPVWHRERKGESSTEQLPWLDGGAVSCPASDPHWVDPSDSQWVEVAMPQPKCGEKEGPASMSQGTQWAMQEKSDSTLSPGFPEPGPEITPPPGFKGVAACLLRDSPSLVPIEVPLK